MVALSLVIVMIAVGTWWFVGGTRVAGGGGFSQGVPGEVAKRWHVGIPLEIEGDGSVRLVSAHVLGAKKMEPVEVRLVRTLTPLGLGGISGELDPALYAAVPLTQLFPAMVPAFTGGSTSLARRSRSG